MPPSYTPSRTVDSSKIFGFVDSDIRSLSGLSVVIATVSTSSKTPGLNRTLRFKNLHLNKPAELWDNILWNVPGIFEKGSWNIVIELMEHCQNIAQRFQELCWNIAGIFQKCSCDISRTLLIHCRNFHLTVLESSRNITGMCRVHGWWFGTWTPDIHWVDFWRDKCESLSGTPGCYSWGGMEACPHSHSVGGGDTGRMTGLC